MYVSQLKKKKKETKKEKGVTILILFCSGEARLIGSQIILITEYDLKNPF